MRNILLIVPMLCLGLFGCSSDDNNSSSVPQAGGEDELKITNHDLGELIGERPMLPGQANNFWDIWEHPISQSNIGMLSNFDTIPSSIDPTGQTDVTDELNNFIASLADSTALYFPQNAIYKTEGIVRFENKNNFLVYGNGATLQSDTDGSQLSPPQDKSPNNWPRSRQHLNINFCTDLKLVGLNIIGPHVNGGISEEAYVVELEAQHGVEIRGSHNIEISQMEISQVYGDFIYIGHGGGTDVCTQINVNNCKMFKNGRQGIGITLAENVVIERNDISQTRRASIDLEPNQTNAFVKNILIRENTFGPGRLNWISSGGSRTTQDVFVFSNRLIGRNAQISVGKVGATIGNIHFNNNYSDSESGNPQKSIWKLYYVDSFYAEGNDVMAQPGREMSLVGQKSSTNIVLGDNSVRNGTNAIIELD